jgi:hypothetical protein
MKISIALILGLAPLLYSDSATQTDWSGGAGSTGPVLEWDSSFSACSSVEASELGLLQLLMEFSLTPVPLGISGAFGLVPLLGDLDLDGDLDLVKVNPARDSLVWMENPGDPTDPWLRHHIAEFEGINAIAVATPLFPVVEVNYDEGTLSKVKYYYRHTSGSWTNTYLGELGEAQYSTGIRTADVDGNGVPDVIGWMWAYDQIRVWWDHGPSQMETILNPHCPTDVFPFDGDGDGDCELAIDRSWYPQTDVFWNQGSGWSASTLQDIFYCMELDAADVDSDWISELLALTYNDLFLCRLSGGSWLTQLVCPDDVQSFRFVEFSGDDHIDIAGVWNDQLLLLNNLGSGAAWGYATAPLGEAYNKMCCADFDADSNPDPVVMSTSTGHVAWIDIDPAYASDAWLESSILYLGCDPAWGGITWTADTPGGTDVFLQVRASDDPGQMGAWSDTITAPCTLEGILTNDDSHVQYRVLMSTSAVEDSPELHEVTISWDPTGVSEREHTLSCGLELLPISPNPATGPVAVSFSVPDPAVVEFALFDLSGRLVWSIEPAEYGSGLHNLVLGDLAAGVYLVRMETESFSVVRRFIITR